MSSMFIKVLNLSINASWLIMAILLLRPLLRKAPKWLHCALWAIVAVRLLLPFSIESALSVLPGSEVIPQDIVTTNTPAIHSQIMTIDNAVNPIMLRELAPKAESSVNPMQVIASVAGTVWIIGVGICLFYALISYLILKKKVSASVAMGDGVMACDEIRTPFILGIIRPMIYVPSSMAGRTLEVVLAHEKAHLKRMDHLWKPLGFLLFSVHWFNPLCLIAYILLCRDIEAACDEKVIRNQDKKFAADYSQALLDLSLPRRMITVCPLAFGETSVKERVKLILNYRKPSFWIIVIGLIATFVLVVCLATDPKKERAITADTNEQETILSAESNKKDSPSAEINREKEESVASRDDYIDNDLKVPEKSAMLEKFSAEDDKAAVNLIYEFVDSVNTRDFNRYVSLFDEENKKEMLRYMDATGNFDFAESGRTILNIEKNKVPPYEKQEGRFEDAVSFCVTEQVKYDDDITSNLDTYPLISGETVHDYVIVKEKGEWKLYRISVSSDN